MATMGGIFIPDYSGTVTTIPSGFSNWVGTIATTLSSGPIFLGHYRLWKLTILNQTAPPNSGVCAVRFTLSDSRSATPTATAPTPIATSPFLHSFHENIWELNAAFDQINLTNLAADNGAITIAYSVMPLVKF